MELEGRVIMSLRSIVSRSRGWSSRRPLKVGLCTGVVAVAVFVLSITSLALADSGFPDVPAGHPYETAIVALSNASIIGGYSNGNFGIDDPVKRAQFAKMIVGTLNITPSASTVTRFTDLGDPDASGYPHVSVQAAYDAGITYGTNSAQTLFSPWNYIRRDQVASMIVRGANSLYPGLLATPPAGTASIFAGVPEPHGVNLRVAYYNGLLDGLIGLGSGWSVGANVTRGEVAQILYNLFRKLPHPAPLPEDLVTLTVADNGRSIQLGLDQILVINLEGIPSSGYRWEPVNLDKLVLNHVDTAFINYTSKLLGAPCDMSLRFVPASKGTISIQLAYERPWERKPLRTYSVSLEVIDRSDKGAQASYELAALRDVNATDKNASGDSSILRADRSSSADLVAAAVTLPSSFDWRAKVGDVAVRSQGESSSCWAFSTVAPLEFNLRRLGLTRDLSEQYLVSCNTDGWTAAHGGWFAHDYHLNKPSASSAAVPEAEFPFVGTDVTCKTGLDHMYQLASWSYVGTSYAVPSTAALKEAIYRYGPVACAVAAGPNFQSYSGGIFSTNESSTTAINHAVDLVGWNDTDGVWILRNSWDTTWGESGYMRIKYGISNVGYAANYVVYPRTQAAPHYQSFMMNIASPLDSKFGWLLARENDSSFVGNTFTGTRLANMENATQETLVSVSGLGGVRDRGISGERKLAIYSSGNVVEYSIWNGTTYTQGEVSVNATVTVDIPQGQSFVINIARPSSSLGAWVFAREHYGVIVGKAFNDAAVIMMTNTSKDNILTVDGLGGVRDTATANQKKVEIYSSGTNVVEYSLWYGATYTQGEVGSGGTVTINIPHYQSFAINIARPASGKSGWLFARENDNVLVGKTFVGGLLAYAKNDTRESLLTVSGLGGICDTGLPGEGGLGLGIFPDLPQAYAQPLEWSLWSGSSYTQGEVR
jgi:C1A family cysteine protease